MASERLAAEAPARAIQNGKALPPRGRYPDGETRKVLVEGLRALAVDAVSFAIAAPVRFVLDIRPPPRQ
jgi:hypothetical protein